MEHFNGSWKLTSVEGASKVLKALNRSLIEQNCIQFATEHMHLRYRNDGVLLQKGVVWVDKPILEQVKPVSYNHRLCPEYTRFEDDEKKFGSCEGKTLYGDRRFMITWKLRNEKEINARYILSESNDMITCETVVKSIRFGKHTFTRSLGTYERIYSSNRNTFCAQDLVDCDGVKKEKSH